MNKRRAAIATYAVAFLATFTPFDIHLAYSDPEHDDSLTETVKAGLDKIPHGRALGGALWMTFATWVYAHFVHDVPAPGLQKVMARRQTR